MEPSPKDGESAAAAEPGRSGTAPSSGVVVQVREKKGPLRAAIPYMPFPVAVICLFLNTFVPGLGLHSADVLFPGVAAPYHKSSAICLFTLERVQALHLQLWECGFAIGFIEAKHLLIRNQVSPEQNELSKELNRKLMG
uniref:Stum, mechanosensory transduction mediator homolog n=1 Tax=Taeniopygia guttata TaxID=59729 RepID=H0Z1J3_TAEGU